MTGPDSRSGEQDRDAQLISPKHFSEFTEDEYYQYVQDLYWVDTAGTLPAPGLSARRVKSGKISITFRKAQRAFQYVTESEIKGMSAHYELPEDELTQAFQGKGYIIAVDRLDAERKFKSLKGEG